VGERLKAAGKVFRTNVPQEQTEGLPDNTKKLQTALDREEGVQSNLLRKGSRNWRDSLPGFNRHRSGILRGEGEEGGGRHKLTALKKRRRAEGQAHTYRAVARNIVRDKGIRKSEGRGSPKKKGKKGDVSASNIHNRQDS